MKKICMFLLTALMVASMCCIAVAAPEEKTIDMEYSGELDSYTGTPLAAEGESRVKLSDTMYYNRQLHSFAYPISAVSSGSGGGDVTANVADGMVTTEAVSISVEEGMDVRLFKDGERLAEQDLTHITGQGNYVVYAGGEDGGELFSFTIVGQQTGLISNYDMPEGFRVTGATCDEERAVWNSYGITMEKEGLYDINYQCPRIGIDYRLKTTVDHTPPFLKLEAVKNNVAKGPVDISDLEEGATITILLNGKNQSYSQTLTRSGTYEITIADKAGNITSYAFTLLVYFDTNSFAFFGVVVASIIAVIVYLVLQRKRLRVR